MFNRRTLMTLAAVVVTAAGCGRYMQTEGIEPGDVIDPAEAKKTVVLEAENQTLQPLELRTSANGQSRFIGAVGSHETAVLLLDPTLFPTGTLYLLAIPPDGRSRALVGPLTAGRGDRIRFTIQPGLTGSRAVVVR